MPTVETQNDLTFDVQKTLIVIEKDLKIKELFMDEVPNLTFSMVKSLAQKNELPEETYEKIQLFFNQIISKNKAPLNQYLRLFSKKNKVKKSKYYGKKRILEDIKNNNHTSELDRALLALNTLRNIGSRLRNKGKSDKENGTKKLSDEDCRIIVAAVRIIENKVNVIFDKFKTKKS